MILLSQAADVAQVPPNDSWLTQPVATIIAALGVILAAIITFRSQEKTRTDQKNQHDSLMAEARHDRETQQRHNDAALAAQREEWQARLRHDGRRERASDLYKLYAEMIKRMSEFDLRSTIGVSTLELKPGESETQRQQRWALTYVLKEEGGESLVDLIGRSVLLASPEIFGMAREWQKMATEGSSPKDLQKHRFDLEVMMSDHLIELQERV